VGVEMKSWEEEGCCGMGGMGGRGGIYRLGVGMARVKAGMWGQRWSSGHFQRTWPDIQRNSGLPAWTPADI
jgi:hypothetical protein